MSFVRGRRSFTRRALSLLAALCVLTSLVLSGHRYFYCALMNEVSLDTCCEAPVGSAETDGPSIERSACCTIEHFAPAAPGVDSQQETALRAPLLAAVAVEPPRSAPPLAATRARTRDARAGPDAPDSREHRLRLMVFLT